MRGRSRRRRLYAREGRRRRLARQTPLVLTLRPFLARHGHPAGEVERMQEAWLKAALLQITLWGYPDLLGGDEA